MKDNENLENNVEDVRNLWCLKEVSYGRWEKAFGCVPLLLSEGLLVQHIDNQRLFITHAGKCLLTKHNISYGHFDKEKGPRAMHHPVKVYLT